MSEPREVDERLSDWVDGRMSARERERFEAELRVNRQLLQQAQEFQRTVATLQQALRQDPGRADLADRVMAALQAAPAAEAKPIRSVRRSALLFGLAAAAALLVTVALLQQWQPVTPPPLQQPVADAPREHRDDQPARDAKAPADKLAEAGRKAGAAEAGQPLGGFEPTGPQRQQQADGGLALAGAPAAAKATAKAAAPDASKAPAAPETGARQQELAERPQPPAEAESALPEQQTKADPAAAARKVRGGSKAPGAAAGAPAGGRPTPPEAPPAGAAPAPEARVGGADAAQRESDQRPGQAGGRAAEPATVQTVVVTRQLPPAVEQKELVQGAGAGRPEAVNKAKAEALTGARPAQDRDAVDQFFLGAASDRSQTLQFGWLGQFVSAPPAAADPAVSQTAALAATAETLGGLSVQTMVLDLRPGAGAAWVRDSQAEAADLQLRARTGGSDPVQLLRARLLELVPPPSGFARLAVVEGAEPEVKQLLRGLTAVADRQQLTVELQELPVPSAEQLQRAPSAPPDAALALVQALAAADTGGTERLARRQAAEPATPPPPPKPDEAKKQAAVPERMRVVICFRELPAPPATEKR